MNNLLTKKDLQLLRSLKTRHGRRKSNSFLCEGLRCCKDALKAFPKMINLVVCSEKFANSAEFTWFEDYSLQLKLILRIVNDKIFSELTETENSQGIILACDRPHNSNPITACQPLFLILDRIQEPGNLGTILRTAWSVNLKEVWLIHGTTDPFSPKAIRAGMGAQFCLTIRSFPNLKSAESALNEIGYPQTWYAGPHKGTNCFSEEFKMAKCAIVIGNEANGITEPNNGDWVNIPMPGTAESLNAAQAATILLFEGVRRGILI